MNDAQLDQFSRQILLDAWGIQAQQRIMNARVLIVGAGGLGSALTHQLVRSGVQVTVFDPDRVESSNLHRQWFGAGDVGQNKALTLAATLKGIGAVDARPQRLEVADLPSFADYDLWLDASDSLATRQIMNQGAVRYGTPWIMGSALGWSGQCAAFDSDSACFDCIFGHIVEPDQQCATSGVLGPVVGQVANTQALWALSFLGGVAALPTHILRRWDGPWGQQSEMKFTKRKACTCQIAP